MSNQAEIYGIKNCDTIKKCLKWMDANNLDYTFHDYKKEVPPEDLIKQAIKVHGWGNTLNKRGTTWRQLPDNVKEKMNEDSALKIALDNPSIIKRPLIVYKNTIHLGFKPDQYQSIFVN